MCAREWYDVRVCTLCVYIACVWSVRVHVYDVGGMHARVVCVLVCACVCLCVLVCACVWCVCVSMCVCVRVVFAHLCV